MAKLKIAGGSDSGINNANNSGSGLRFFKGDIPFIRLTKTNVGSLTGFILPAFDSNMSTVDSTYATSYEPYRLAGTLDKETNEPKFSNWYYTFDVYDFFGDNYHSIISPISAGMPDPIGDLRMYIYTQRKRYNDTTYMYLVDKKYWGDINAINDFKQKVALPSAAKYTFMNVFSTSGEDGDTTMANRVLMLRPGAQKELISTLNRPRTMRDGAAVDPVWADYKIGDVTNPNAAIQFGVKLIPTENNASIMFPVLDFAKPNELKSIPASALAGRYELDDDSVLNIPTYDEMVNILINETSVPYDLIKFVCQKRCENFPAAPAKHYAAPEQTFRSTLPTPAAAEASMPAPVEPAKTFRSTLPTPVATETSMQAPVEPVKPSAINQVPVADWKPNTSPLDFGDDDIPMDDPLPANAGKSDEDRVREIISRALRNESMSPDDTAFATKFRQENMERYRAIVRELKEEADK